jgi:hypothetical protein
VTGDSEQPAVDSVKANSHVAEDSDCVFPI